MCSRPEWPPPPRASAHALLASPVASLRHGRRRVLHLHQTPAALGRLPAVPFRVGQARYGRAAAPSPPSPRVPSSARLLDSFFLCVVVPFLSLAVPADSACPVVEVAEDDSVVCSLVAPPACGGGGEEVAWCEIRRNAGTRRPPRFGTSGALSLPVRIASMPFSCSCGFSDSGAVSCKTQLFHCVSLQDE